jgi:NDP-sugar pyrophosphorylase family protein
MEDGRVNDCTGVILAAGRGRRMGALSDTYPKPILPVGNLPLIGHHLQFLASLGITDVIVVVGYQRDRIVSVVDEIGTSGTRVRFVDQEHALGSAHALARVRPLVRGSFVVLLGDYFFRLSNPYRVIERVHAGEGVIAAKREADPRLVAEACVLKLDPAGQLLGIVEKPAVPGDGLKGCGVYGWPAAFFDALGRTPRTALRDEYEITVAIELYVQSGRRVFGEEIVLWDANMTRPEDLLECNLHWLAEHGQSTSIAPGAEVEPGSRLERTLVGSGAFVGRDAELNDVVVFAGARVPPGAKLSRALVAPQCVVPCELVNESVFRRS